MTGFAKGVFHIHPIYQLWQSITSDWKQSFPWNLNSSEYQHRLIDAENFSFACALLQSSKFIELGVCGRPFFTNPVTYVSAETLEKYFDSSHSSFSRRLKVLYRPLTCKIQFNHLECVVETTLECEKTKNLPKNPFECEKYASPVVQSSAVQASD